MTGRYIALCGTRDARQGAEARVKDSGAMHQLLDTDGLALFVDDRLPHCPLDNGVLLGRIFLRGQTTAARALDDAKQAAARATQGEFLVETCWGSYVALLPDPTGPAWHVLRAPLGMLPCLVANRDGIVWVASDVPLLEQAGFGRPPVDWDALTLHLAKPELRHSRTCLAGIIDLLGGHRLKIGTEPTTLQPLWTPWPFAARPEVQPADAATRLRGAIDLTVAAMSDGHDRALLMLSGGIDSSIVAASLKRAGRDFETLTFRPDGAGGDESDYARTVADHLAVPWHEIRPDPDRVDPGRSASGHLPRPNERLFYQEFDRAGIALARTLGAGAILHGGGGDNLFYGHPSVAPIADCLLTANGRFKSSAAALADLTGSSLWRVMALATRRALRKKRPLDTASLRLRFLAVGTAVPDRLHAWEAPPEGILPGRSSHAALLAHTLSLVEAADPLRAIPNLPVLLSQPLLQTCLEMPTDLWFAPGRNRAIAREAFARDLPANVIERRSKGTPDAFVATIFERKRREIRALLLDGELAAHGLLNRPLLASVLDDPAPSRGYDFARILELVDAEAWVRSRA